MGSGRSRLTCCVSSQQGGSSWGGDGEEEVLDGLLVGESGRVSLRVFAKIFILSL